MDLGAHGAYIIGGIAGIISTLGFNFLSPFLHKKLHLDDTCGIHNLHALPGLIGAIASIISTAVIDYDSYGGYESLVFSSERGEDAFKRTNLVQA